VVLAIIILKIYNINPAIIIKAGTIYIIDLIVPVTGKLTIAVGDADTLAMIISVGVAVGAPGAIQQASYEGLALQAVTKSGEEQ
jgi:hypothetical protein